jgi:hypothetical protein
VEVHDIWMVDFAEDLDFSREALDEDGVVWRDAHYLDC